MAQNDNWQTEAVERLSRIIDGTDFGKEPYRGILTRVAAAMGYKGGRKTIHAAIKRHRTLAVMIEVVKEIESVEKSLRAAYAGLEVDGENEPRADEQSTDNERV